MEHDGTARGTALVPLLIPTPTLGDGGQVVSEMMDARIAQKKAHAPDDKQKRKPWAQAFA